MQEFQIKAWHFGAVCASAQTIITLAHSGSAYQVFREGILCLGGIVFGVLALIALFQWASSIEEGDFNPLLAVVPCAILAGLILICVVTGVLLSFN